MRPYGLADVFLEWPGLPPDDPRSAVQVQETGCFDLHGLHWQESFIALEGGHRICHYRAPDAESVRIAFRQGGIRLDAIWSGTLIQAGDGGAPQDLVIEWSFESPWPASPAAALERAQREGLGALGFEPVRAIVPADRRRIICLGASPATLPALPRPVIAWRFRHVAP